MVANKSVIFNAVPTGIPVPGQTTVVETSEMDLDTVPLHDGLLTKTVCLSLDPYMRGRMRAPEAKSYNVPFELGKPLANFGVSEVLRSDHADFKKGQHVYGFTPFSEYNVFTVHHIAPTGLKVLENKEGLPWTQWVGAAGMPGLTAHWAYTNIGKPVKGETIFVSAASGAVGQIVAQLAKRDGLKVIGSAGSDDKVAFLKELGCFDVAFNYKKESTKEILVANPPDIFFDNVGGETLEIVLDTMSSFGRIIACGQVSQYNLAPKDRHALYNTVQIVAKQITFQGFIITGKDSTKFYAEVPKMIASGELKIKEHIVKGLDNAGSAFVDLLDGTAFGKVVISLESPVAQSHT